MKNNFKIAFNTYDLPLIKLVEKLWQHFSSKRKLQAKILVFLMLISSISELISFGSIIPFLSVLSLGDTNNENLYIRFISNITGLKNINEIFYLFIIIFIIAALFSAFTSSTPSFQKTTCSANERCPKNFCFQYCLSAREERLAQNQDIDRQPIY